MNLSGKVAVITGSASGIGKATMLAFAQAGAHVIGADIDAEKNAAAVGELTAQKLSAEPVKIDMSSSDSIRACAAAIMEKHPKVDVLVNTAGYGNIEPFANNKPDYIDLVIAINLGGVIHLSQALLPALIAAGKGKIVNVASDAGRVGSSGETAYAGAKGGVIAFTKSLAREVARHSICVNCVCPGPTDTPMLRSRPEKLLDAFLKAIPFKRFAEPREIADAILFFASPRSDYVTAQVLSVSGGLTFAG
ncbi:MAG: SDR family NAD(P)-dependent oxidoreductase [Xanthobacteraceae bacterium]